MSEEKEESDAPNIPNAAGESDDVHETINIPVISEELPESDQTEDNESELEPSGGGHETRAKEHSDQSSSSLESNEEQILMEEATTSERVSGSPRRYKERYLREIDNATQSAKQHSDGYYLAYLDRMKTVKESLKTAVIASSATGIT